MVVVWAMVSMSSRLVKSMTRQSGPQTISSSSALFDFSSSFYVCDRGMESIVVFM